MKRLASAAVVVIAAIAGCLRSNGAFHCTTDMDCVTSTSAGTCQSTGFCSFPDGTCPNGRYGSLSGTLSNQCVSLLPDDAAIADARMDADRDGPPGPPMFVGTPGFGSAGSEVSLAFTMTIPPGSKRMLIVSAEMSASLTLSPTISSITYAGQSMTMLFAVVGADDGTATRTEQWGLIAPPVGTDIVTITLATPGVDIHGNGMAFTGVNQTNPIRDIEGNFGDDVVSTVSVTSDPNDLVESTVGQGHAINGALSPATTRFIDPGDTSTSLNNAAGATTPGLAGSASIGWTYGAQDIWQEICASLEP